MQQIRFLALFQSWNFSNSFLLTEILFNGNKQVYWVQFINNCCFGQYIHTFPDPIPLIVKYNKKSVVGSVESVFCTCSNPNIKHIWYPGFEYDYCVNCKKEKKWACFCRLLPAKLLLGCYMENVRKNTQGSYTLKISTKTLFED